MACRRKCCSILVGLFLIWLVLLVLTYICKPKYVPPGLLKYDFVDLQTDNVVQQAGEDIKYVLFFTNYWHFLYWGLSAETIDKSSPEMENCRFKNCVFTHKRRLLNRMHQYDAVFFHQGMGAWYHKENLESIKTRSPHQLYVLMSHEAPKIFPLDYLKYPDFFNLTMTYRIDSDILYAYGQTVEIDSGYKIAPAYDIKWMQPNDNFSDENYLKVIRKKTRSAVWFVSQCNRSSRRDELAEKLKDFINIDIYGACGQKVSPHGPNLYNQTFKFYLAFENSLCQDYLTEKTFKVMNSLIIPVIYSGVDLSRFLPPKSYIDANSFQTVEQLGTYLKFLEENPEEYVKYFWWKNIYKVQKDDSINVCEICKKLNEPNLHAKQNIYLDINKWFGRNSCTEAKIKF